MALPCFVVNLSSRPDRLSYIQAALSAVDLTFEVIDAVDATKCSPDIFDRFEYRKSGYHFSPGEIGCFLSHEMIWSTMIAKHMPYAVIFEDDIRISRRISGFLGSDGWLPPDMHLLKLETMYFRADIDRSPTFAADGLEVRRLRSKHLGSAAYVVSLEGAKRLLNKAQRPFGPVDHHLFDPYIRGNDGLVRYQAVPALAVQHANDPTAAWTLSIFASGIEGVSAGRHSKRITLREKIWREIKRPFRQFLLYQRRSYSRKRHDAEAIIVEFAEDGVLDRYIEKIRNASGLMSIPVLEKLLDEKQQD